MLLKIIWVQCFLCAHTVLSTLWVICHLISNGTHVQTRCLWVAASEAHELSASPVQQVGEKREYVLKPGHHTVEETDGLQGPNWLSAGREDCFLPKGRTVQSLSEHPWARPVPSPLSVVAQASPIHQGHVRPLGSGSSCWDVLRLLWSCPQTVSSLVPYSVMYVDPGLLASRTPRGTTHLRTSWDMVSMSFQFNDLLSICLKPATCPYPAKPCSYKSRKQIPLTLMWYFNCHCSFSLLSCIVYCVQKTISLSPPTCFLIPVVYLLVE